MILFLFRANSFFDKSEFSARNNEHKIISYSPRTIAELIRFLSLSRCFSLFCERVLFLIESDYGNASSISDAALRQMSIILSGHEKRDYLKFIGLVEILAESNGIGGEGARLFPANRECGRIAIARRNNGREKKRKRELPSYRICIQRAALCIIPPI